MTTRYDMQNILLNDIMDNMLDPQNVDTIREAVRTYLDIFENDELLNEINEKGLSL